MKNRVLLVLKIVLPLAIIGWLVSTIEPEQIEQLRSRPLNWGMLAGAFVLGLGAVCVTFLRWFVLVRALEIPFRLADAFRLGFLAYLLNFVSIGNVGGDLFKAFFIAREQPGRRTEAVATVVVDRLLGLYSLLITTSLAILAADIQDPSPALAAICNLNFLATGLGGIFVLLLLTPGFTRGSLSETMARLPKIGPTLDRLIQSARLFRSRRFVIIGTLLMGIVVHTLLTTAVFLIALSLFGEVPPIEDHFIIVPLSNVAGSLPFTPAGLGSFELAMEELYKYVPQGGPGIVVGVLVALGYRIMTIGIAGVGVVYYWTSRREVQQVLEEAQ